MPAQVHVSVYLFSYSFDFMFWKHDAGKNSDHSWNRVFFPEEHPKITQTEMLVYFNNCVHLNVDILIALFQSNAPNSSGLSEQRFFFLFTKDAKIRCLLKILSTVNESLINTCCSHWFLPSCTLKGNGYAPCHGTRDCGDHKLRSTGTSRKWLPDSSGKPQEK